MSSPSKGAALIYCRVSTSRQAEEGTSLDSQEEAGVRCAQERGYAIGRVTRQQYSGAELYDRPLLARDRADLKAGRFQALIAYSTDRLSRDPIHLAIIAEDCQRSNVDLLFVTEPLDTSPEGQLIQYIKGYSNKLEREKIRERQLRGKRQRALNGKVHNAGPELYGYRCDKENGVRAIYELEAHVVRQIYHWIVTEHVGGFAVARRLNRQGVPPPSSGKMTYPDPERVPRWGKTQITRLVQNPSYKGETYAWRTQRPATASDRQLPNFDAEQRKLIRPRREWIRLPDHVTPPIVSPDLWEQAQEVLREVHSEATRNEKHPHLLRGLVYCGVCGKRMYSDIENSNHPNRADVYRCSSRQRAGGKCGGSRIPSAEVEAWAWERVCAVLRKPDLIAAELKRLQTEGPNPLLSTDLETARRELAKRQKKQATLLERFSAADDDGAFPWELVEREITRLEREKQQFQAAIDDLEARIRAQQQAVTKMDALNTYCQRVADRLDSFGFEDKRLALEALRIRITGNGRDWTLSGRIPLPEGDTAQHVESGVPDTTS